MTRAVNIPSDPKDGHVIVYWTIAMRGLEQHRLTFIANKTHAEVCGRGGGNGAPWVNDWKCETRAIPGSQWIERVVDGVKKGGWFLAPAGEWNTTGRGETERLAEWHHGPEGARYDFATYAEAKAALMVRNAERIASCERDLETERRFAKFMAKHEEPSL